MELDPETVALLFVVAGVLILVGVIGIMVTLAGAAGDGLDDDLQ